jgi:hypothetical protein
MESTGQGGEGLPQTTPLLSAWGRKWALTPQGSMVKPSQRSLMHCARKPYETHPRGEVFDMFTKNMLCIYCI